MADADAVLIVTPEYNGSIPGALKNALDWGSRPRETAVFRGKPVAVIGASTGSFGGIWAHAETRKILGLMGSRVVDAELRWQRRTSASPRRTTTCSSSCARWATSSWPRPPHVELRPDVALPDYRRDDVREAPWWSNSIVPERRSNGSAAADADAGNPLPCR